MACSKYTLTNTGSSITNFSYRRCDDNMWQYQVPLDPSEVKNIWLINNSYSTAFSNAIVLVDQGAFPPLNATATPTPTPTLTPTNTPTPSITASQTPTQTQTQTQTQTPSQTQTQTPTQTTTQTSTPTPTPTPFNYSFALGYGDTPNAACSATSTSLYTTRSGLAPIELFEILYTNAILTETAANGYYSDGTNWYEVDSTLNGIDGQVTFIDLNGCSTLVTPTVTPSVTATNTPTPSVTPSATPIARYEWDVLCHSESNADDACGCVGTATLFSNSPVFSASTLFWSDRTGVNTGNPVGFYALDNILYYVDDNCGVGCSTGSTLGYTTFCNATPTPTSTQILTPTPSTTPTNTPTNTQTGTPAVTPSPTPSSFDTNTFKVTMFGTSRALLNSYTLTESPYIGSSGVGFSATTGTYPLAAGPATVYGTHAALSSSTVTFEINSSGSGSVSIFYFVNGSIVSGLNNSAISSGPNTYNLFVAGPVLVTDTIEFQIS